MAETQIGSGLTRRFLRLAAINIVSNIMAPLAGLIDVAFLGHLHDIRYLAGVALATVIFDYLYWSFGFLRMSTTGLTAQAVGRQDPEAVVLIGLRHGLLALAVGVGLIVCSQPLQTLGFGLLSGSEEIKQAGSAYFSARIWGAPALLINYVCLGWFLGQEKSHWVLMLALITNVAYVSLDYLLIVMWGWGSWGAGLATALSDWLALGVALGWVRSILAKVDLGQVGRQLWDPPALKAVFALNGDITLRTLVLVTTFAAFTNIGSQLGTEVLAANAVLLQVFTLTAYGVDGLAFATESLVGIFYGQGSHHLLRVILRLSGGWSLGCGLAFALLFVCVPALFQLMTNQPLVLAQIHRQVGWLIPVLGFGSLAFMLDGYFLGLTAGRMLREAILEAAVLGFAPLAALAWIRRDPQGLWLALSGFMAARVVTLGRRIRVTDPQNKPKP